MAVEWSMDDVAEAQARLEERARPGGAGRVVLGSDADLMLGPDLDGPGPRLPEVTTAKQWDRVDEGRRRRAEAEWKRQAKAEPAGRGRSWPRPRSASGAGWLVVLLAARFVEWLAFVVGGLAVRRLARPARSEGRAGRVGWLVVGLVLVAVLGGAGGSGVVGAVVAGVAGGLWWDRSARRRTR